MTISLTIEKKGNRPNQN